MGVVDLGRVIDEGVVAWRRYLLVGQYRVDRIDHVVGGQLVAVVEGDVRSQREFQRGLVHPFVRFGEQRLELKGLRVAIDQRIPDLMADHDAGAKLVVVRRDVGHGVAPGDAQRVGRFLRHRRRGSRRQCRHQDRTTENLAHRHRLLAMAATVGSAPGKAKGFIPNPAAARNSATAAPAARRHGSWCDRHRAARRSARRSAIRPAVMPIGAALAGR